MLRAALLRKNFSLRKPDADLIDEVRCRTVCLDELTCASARCSDGTLPGLAPTNLPPTNTLKSRPAVHVDDIRVECQGLRLLRAIRWAERR